MDADDKEQRRYERRSRHQNKRYHEWAAENRRIRNANLAAELRARIAAAQREKDSHEN